MTIAVFSLSDLKKTFATCAFLTCVILKIRGPCIISHYYVPSTKQGISSYHRSHGQLQSQGIMIELDENQNADRLADHAISSHTQRMYTDVFLYPYH